jgi:hypothetical protein
MPASKPHAVNISRIEASNDSVQQRIALMAKLSVAVREIFVHQIRLQSPELSDFEVRCEAARRIYRNDKMIQRFLNREH